MSPPDPTPAGPAPAAPPRRPALDAVVVWGVTFVGLLVLGVLRAFVPFVATNLLAFVAVLFLYLPLFLLWRRREDPADLGITSRGWPRDVAVAGVAMLALFPPFVLGYHLWHGMLLDHPPTFAAERLARWSPPLDGPPRDLETSSAVHVWAVGDRLAVTGGARLEGGHEVTLQADTPCAAVSGAFVGPGCPAERVVCRVGPETGCVVRAPEWRRLTVRAASGPPLRVGELGEEAGSAPSFDRDLTWWWVFVLVQLGLVALPEEVFYRGYLQSRFDRRWPPRWRFLGANVGPGLFATAALFALGHLAIDPGPQRLAVFFPALLFGWLRARTGTVVAAVVVHGASNVLIRAVASFYY